MDTERNLRQLGQLFYLFYAMPSEIIKTFLRLVFSLFGVLDRRSLMGGGVVAHGGSDVLMKGIFTQQGEKEQKYLFSYPNIYSNISSWKKCLRFRNTVASLVSSL